MKRCILLFILILVLPLQFSSAFQSKKQGKSGNSILGTWQATEDGETVTLVFKSSTLLVFDGEKSEYRLVPGAIKVQEESGETDYQYSLRGDILTIIFPDGEEVQFRRTKPAAGSAEAHAGRTIDKKSGRNESHLLVGKFMSYSSSSSSTGSSSWTTYAAFDGRGNFSWNSESAHNTRNYDQQGNQTGAGVAYGADDGKRGTYRVAGSRIIVTFNDGPTDEAEITERFSDGSIGAFKYNGKTFAR